MFINNNSRVFKFVSRKCFHARLFLLETQPCETTGTADRADFDQQDVIWSAHKRPRLFLACIMDMFLGDGASPVVETEKLAPCH